MKAVILFLLSITLLQAAPAYTGERTITLADGSTVKASLRGDEYLNWFETESGEIILYSKSRKQFEHPMIVDNDLKPSGVTYTSGSNATRASALQPSVSKSEIAKIWKEKRAKSAAQRHKRQ